MKKRIIVGLLTAIIISLTGCASETSRDTEKVEGIISDVDYRKPYYTWSYNPATKGMTSTHHSADYDVFIEYDNKIYEFDNEEIYDLCKDNVGESIECDYIIIYYDNNTFKTFLTIEGYQSYIGKDK